MKVLDTINPFIKPQWIDPNDDMLVYRERIAQNTFLSFTVLFIIVVINNILSKSEIVLTTIVPNLILFLIVVIFTIYRKGSIRLRIFTLLTVIYLMGLSNLAQSGRSGDGRLLLLSLTIFSTILLGIRGAIISNIMSVFTNGIILGLISTKILPSPPLPADGTPYTITFTFITVLCTFAVYIATSGFEKSFTIQKTMNQKFDKEREILGNTLNEKEISIHQKDQELHVDNQLAYINRHSNNLDQLTNLTVQMIQQTFGFQSAGVFLLDERKEYADLLAATNDVMEDKNKYNRIKINENYIFRTVILTGETSSTQSPLLDTLEIENPSRLGSTLEIALPIMGQQGIVGVLDLRKNHDKSSSSGEIALLQTITEQLGLEMEKYLQVIRSQAKINELEKNLREFTAESWRSHIRSTHKNYAYKYVNQDIVVDLSEEPESQEARKSGQLILTPNQKDPRTGDQYSSVAIPIKLRQQVIGVMNIRFDSQNLPHDMVNFVESATDRLALALENVRLLETIQIRADREHIVANISDKIRSTTDVESILKTAANELGHTLGVTDVVVQLLNSEKTVQVNP